MPISPTYNVTAASAPVPIAPVSPAIGAGASGPFTTGMVAGVSVKLNQMFAMASVLGQAGGGANAIMGAVGTSLALSAGSGLTIVMAAGVALMDQVWEVTGSVSVANSFQAPIPNAYTLPDNSTSYVWLTKTCTLTSATTTSPPVGSRVYLGQVTTSGGVVTAIDYGGVWGLSGATFIRTTGDIGPPTDTPSNPGVVTATTTGKYVWNGSNHVRQEPPANVQTISGTLTLSATSSRTQLLTASGGNQIVKLPALTSLEVGAVITIWNQGASNNITIQTSSGGSISGGLTLTPGQAVTIPVCTSGGTNAWPASGVTAVTPSTGGVVGPGV